MIFQSFVHAFWYTPLPDWQRLPAAMFFAAYLGLGIVDWLEGRRPQIDLDAECNELWGNPQQQVPAEAGRRWHAGKNPPLPPEAVVSLTDSNACGWIAKGGSYWCACGGWKAGGAHTAWIDNSFADHVERRQKIIRGRRRNPFIDF